MDEREVEAALARCEQALASGAPVDLRALGFWRAVAAVKRNPDWIPRYAERIAAIDRRVFDQSVRLRIPIDLGIAGLALGAAMGLALVVASSRVGRPWKDLFLLASEGVLIVSTHDLAHFAVGQALGIRFDQLYLGGKLLAEPGLKTDYASYLRASPEARAWMHASGAIVSKVVPFALLAIAVKQRAARWVDLALLASGLGALATDIFLSTRYSDWKRFGREMGVARHLAVHPPR